MNLINIIRKSNKAGSKRFYRFKYKLFKCYQWIVKRDLRWLLVFTVARFPIGRNIATWLHRQLSSKRNNIQNTASVFNDLDIDLAVASIKKNGYYLGLQLPQNYLQEILEFAYSEEISVDNKPKLNFRFADKQQAEIDLKQNIIIGSYLNAPSKCLALKKLGNDGKLKEIASRYLENEAILVRSHLGWCFPGKKEAYAEKGDLGNPLLLFHYDLDDYRALKFFFYLTDVDALSGSHLCIAGSHQQRKLQHYLSRSQSSKDIMKFYGSKRLIRISGRSGFGFAEDPFCFHRGTPPVTSPRLMIQLEFALHDYGKWE
ncbi:MAG: hypothetical protein AAF383_20240 [Cyanobacteria bacterium P01_A01_bin.83]